MSAARLTDLVYGHVGEPVYDVESHKWHFTRIPTIGLNPVDLIRVISVETL